jgi:superfamily II DNA/RNA helicase
MESRYALIPIHLNKHNGINQVIIATPGRLLDIISHQTKMGETSLLTYVNMFVIDEVDIMLQMGFSQQESLIFIIFITKLLCRFKAL